MTLGGQFRTSVRSIRAVGVSPKALLGGAGAPPGPLDFLGAKNLGRRLWLTGLCNSGSRQYSRSWPCSTRESTLGTLIIVPLVRVIRTPRGTGN